MVRAPIAEALPRPSIETPMIKLKATVAANLKAEIDGLKKLEVNVKEGKKLAEG